MQSILASFLVLFGICAPILTRALNFETECQPIESVMSNETSRWIFEPFYHNCIRLNVSNKFVEGYYLFEIIVDCLHTECKPYSEQISELNSTKEINDTIITIPPLSQDNPMWQNFILGGNYSVTFYYRDRKNGHCLNYADNITIPECLPDKDYLKCSCKVEKYQPKVVITKIEHDNDNIYTIYWDINNKTSPSDLISDVFFEYNKNHTEYFEFEDILWQPNSSFAKVVFSEPIELTKDYKIIGEFYNIYGCLADVEYTFEDTDVIPPYKLIICLVVVITSIIVLAVTVKMICPCMKINCTANHKKSNLRNIVITKECILSAQKKLVISPAYIGGPIYNPFESYEIPLESITFIKQLGKGNFGTVFEAQAFNIKGTQSFTKVAVKTHRKNPTKEELLDFLYEIEMMIKVGEHENIVRFLGCCTINQPYYMVMEFLAQDLKQYLIGLREKWKEIKTSSSKMYMMSTAGGYRRLVEAPASPVSYTSSRFPSTSTDETDLSSEPSSPLLLEESYTPDKVLETTELQSFALQIARGMAHLEKIGITHRDLAARNILLNEDKILKISDFGLSKTGSYISFNLTRLLPLRWMALESIIDRICNNKTDVWSFGVVLWEIGTLGAFPYSDIDDKSLIGYLKQGRRLERPEICTEELYKIMLQCWSEQPPERPTFQELVELLDVKKKRVYADLNLLDPDYVFLPTSYEETGT